MPLEQTRRDDYDRYKYLMAHQLLNNNMATPPAINVFVIDAIFLRDHIV